MPLKQILVLVVTLSALFLGYIIGAPLLGALGEQAHDSEGTNGEGFNVPDETVDKGAEVALVHVPVALLTGVGAWMFLSLLLLLAFRGVV